MAAKYGFNVLNRRDFLRLSGLALGAGALSACTAPVAPASAPAEGATGEAAPAGDHTTVAVWYQDWDGANRIMNWVKPEFEKNHPEAIVELQPIGYDDLLAKLLPSIAAGTEVD